MLRSRSIVAAKGALRFPEIQASSGISGVTEYFLIGTPSSMLLALGMVVLVWVRADVHPTPARLVPDRGGASGVGLWRDGHKRPRHR